MSVFRSAHRPAAVICLTLAAAIAGYAKDNSHRPPSDNGDSRPAKRINAPGGHLQATIKTTTGGVPHIIADNLEAAAFGEGYVQARGNVCIIADAILRATGQRARYYGPGPNDINIITDFSTKALGVLAKAKATYARLTPAVRAMLRGFTEGYNQYVDETDPMGLPSRCAGQPWVTDITPQQLYADYELIALLASGDQFTTGVTFAAAPPGIDPAPAPATPRAARHMPALPDFARIARAGTPASLGLKTDYHNHGMASNGWGIGGALTENGRGALLANPHLPYTGNRRFYQSQITVPGVYNVNGAGLIGFVLPLIGFNRDIAWTHTVSTATHFTVYRLRLAPGDDRAYIKDGQKKPITAKTFTIQVANGASAPITLKKTFYYSEYGPMIAANLVNPHLPAWGDAFAGHSSAFTYRDANVDTARQVIDQWLAMGRAHTLVAFKKPFAACGSVLWVNTIYADATGHAFYIDGSAVPHLSAAALTAYAHRKRASPVVVALGRAGIILLDGATSRDDWIAGDCDGRIPYAGMPKLERRDFVQNANDSYWATNPKAPLTGASPLYGPSPSILSPRTRMGLKMLEHPRDPGLSKVKPGGDDGRFNAQKLIAALYSNRAYDAETLLGELVKRCRNAGDTAIDTGDGAARSIAAGCSALAHWNGVYDTDSRGAAVFRVFMASYDPSYPAQFTVPFDPRHPATTPSTPVSAPADTKQDPMLIALARGLDALDAGGIAYNAPLGQVQYEQQSAGVAPGGVPAPAGPRIPWPGAQNLEGGFDIAEVVTSPVAEGTRYPRVAPAATIPKTGGLSATRGQGWLVGRGTSWHFALNFTAAGPRAYGLVSYSQSADPSSPHFSDQDRRFSHKRYRKLLYTEKQIDNDPNLQVQILRSARGAIKP